jgi:hypothetical protein
MIPATRPDFRLIALVLSWLAPVGAAAQLSWTWHNPVPHGYRYEHLGEVDGRVAAFGLGAAGFVVSGDGGRNWILQSKPPVAFDAVAYGNGRYVGVGSFGLLTTSSDGLNWNSTPWPRSKAPNYYGVAFGGPGNLFVAVGDSGIIQTSEDGTAWTTRDSANHPALTGIVRVPDRFVVIGQGGTVLSSPDGIRWTREASGTTLHLRRLRHTGSRFLALGGAGLFASEDGKAWDSLPLSISLLDRDVIRAVAEGNGCLVIAGDGARLYTGCGGGAFAPTLYEPGHEFQDVIFHGGAFLAVGEHGMIHRSTDGRSWGLASGPAWSFRGLAYGDGRFLAATGTDTVLESPDGTAWSRRVLPDIGRRLGRMTYSGGFLSAGDSGRILSSPDGVAWTSAPSGLAPYPTIGYLPLTRVVLGGDAVVAVGILGQVASSNGGAAFAPRASGTGATLHGLAHGQGVFVAVGDSGTVVTSADGMAWTRRSSGTVKRLNAACHGAGLFVAGGEEGLFTSPDGLAWTRREADLTMDIVEISYGGGLFLASAWDAFDQEFLTSPDGIHWTTRYHYEMRSGISQIAFGAGRFAAAGRRGALLSGISGSAGLTGPEGSAPGGAERIRIVHGSGGPRAVIPARLGQGPMTARLLDVSGRVAAERTASPTEGLLALPRPARGQGAYLLRIDSPLGVISGFISWTP